MGTIHIPLGCPYDVVVEHGALSRAGELTAAVKSPCRVLLTADSHVAPLYFDAAAASFSHAGYAVSSFIFPAGEESKSPATLFSLLERAAECGLTRSDLFVALGGGVTGDLTGLAAALYLRGVDYVGLPTSLLAAVDSSVGGKTAVDLTHGKNLAGAFHQPILVVCDPAVLETLPDVYVADGAAEIVKYGMLADPDLLTRLSDRGPLAEVESLILRSVEIKRDIVCRDELDRGERKLLNFGHTIGHAVEVVSGYAVPHGHAVAIGMTAVTAAAEAEGFCHGCAGPLAAALSACALDGRLSFPPEALLPVMLRDKKREGDTISLVLPKSPGHCVLRELPVSRLGAFLFPRASSSSPQNSG